MTHFRHFAANLFRYLDKLSLTRQEMNTLFRHHLGRDAAEENMLALLTTLLRDALERMTLGSPEYAARRQTRRAV